MTDLPNEIMVWHSMEKLTHIGTWATERYPEEAVAYVPLADAQAAQAMVVERCAEVVTPQDVYGDGRYFRVPGFHQEGCAYKDNDLITAANIAVERIRALADIDGLALVQELRAERDSFRAVLDGAGYGDVDSIAKNDVETSRALGGVVQALTLQGFAKREAERDRLAAANAVLEAKVAGLVSYGDPALGGSPLTDETPAQHEERTCTCGAGHGSLEGHTDWCDFTAYQSLETLAEVQGQIPEPGKDGNNG